MRIARPLALRWGLLPLGLYLALAAGAAFVVPSEYSKDPRPTPPDEGAHLGYIDYLLRQHKLPVFLSQDDNYEAHQPPLYYLSSLVPYRLGLALAPGQSGLTRPGIVLVRLWSALLAGLSIWIAWLLGRRFFGSDNLLSLAPALFLALWPGRLMIVAAVTNDGLAEALCLLTFYLAVQVLAEGLEPRRVVLLGAAWALALMTKSTSLSLGPTVLLALLLRSVHDEPEDQGRALARTGRALLTAAVPLLVIAGWWFVRNQVLYGDPLAARMFNELFSKDRATPDYFFSRGLSGGAYYLLVVINTALSFWGVFGQANVYQSAGYYYAGFLISAAAVVGLLARVVRERLTPVPAEPPGKTERGEAARRRARRKAGDAAALGAGGPSHRGMAAPEAEPPWLRPAWGLAWLLLVTVVIFFLRFNTEFYQAQARYLFAASGPLALLFTLGLWNLQRRRWGLYCLGAALALMLVMSVWSVVGFAGLVAAHYGSPLLGG